MDTVNSVSGLESVAEDPDHVTESFLGQGEQGEQAEARYTRTGHITLTPEPSTTTSVSLTPTQTLSRQMWYRWPPLL